MKKVILILAVAMCSLLSYSQTNLMVWNNGRMQYAQPITNIDSITFPASDDMDADTLHLILPRHITYVVHDTVKVYVHDTVYIKQDALKGAFSVSANKQVIFSKGCLQYTQSTNTWEFANEQYEILGEANVNNGALADKIDLFGWSANNTTAQWGISTSATASDYSGDFVDWGKNIGDGNTWRTLSKDEWYYLFYTRTNAATLFGLGSVNGINGTIILPDNWVCPSGITFNPSTTKGLTDQGNYYYNSIGDNFSHNTFTLSQWKQLEQAGAVFLPAAGGRYEASVSTTQANGYRYWSSTANGTYDAYNFIFSGSHFNPQGYSGRNNGQAVRLVQDVE